MKSRRVIGCNLLLISVVWLCVKLVLGKLAMFSVF